MFLLDGSFFEIRQTEEKGRGVFALKDIQPGVVIGDYLGKIITYEEDNVTDGLYSMEYGKGLLILADKNSIGIHYMNHSCMPNCCIYPYKDRGIFVTLRKIFVGEELCVSYLIDPDDPEDYPCYCKTSMCNGSMKTTQKKSNEMNQFIQTQMKKYNKKLPAKQGDELLPLTSYPANISDVELYDLYGNIEASTYPYSASKDLTVAEVRKIIRDSGTCILDVEHNNIIIGVCDGTMVKKMV